MTTRPVPDATVSRLPLYLRVLVELADQGEATVSSDVLADAAGVSSANVRKDLSHLGSYGTRGGFRVAALIDVDPAKVGSRIDGMEVRHLDELPKLVRAERVAIGVIATPATDAQDVADRMVQAGLRSILNFAPAMLTVPEGVTIRKVDLAIELQILSYYEQRDALRELKGSIGKPGGAIAGS